MVKEISYSRGEIISRLQYRRLLSSEIFIYGKEREHLYLLEEMTAEGTLHKEAAMQLEKGTVCCRRCGNKSKQLFAEVRPCSRCEKPCKYCRACLAMGRITSCSSLYFLPDGKNLRPAPGAGAAAWRGELTKEQRRAADQLVRRYREETCREFLLWAVCGAGKTEMLFPLIQEALQREEAVMICTPRRDVVQELEPRLQEAFPSAQTAGFYGGKEPEERFRYADIAVATTHQLLRFYRSYSLVIIDEVDAFPYTADRKLKYAAAGAVKEKGMTVYVTATPSRLQQRLAKSGRLESALVSRRYHSGDLPVPEEVWAGNWKKRLNERKLPSGLRNFLERNQGKQVLLFVPTVGWLEPVQEALKKWNKNLRTASVHSAEEERSARVKAFREGETNILITTTILERGITIENVQVAVVGAEDVIFTETALIQIAGRAGRSSRYPTGEVAFFHYGSTRASKRAIRTIIRLNRRNS